MEEKKLEINTLEEDMDMFDQEDDVFPHKYELRQDVDLTKGFAYVLTLALSSNNSQIAAGLSNSKVAIVDAGTLKQKCIWESEKGLNGVVFSPLSENLLYSSSPDVVQVWDLRESNKQPVKSFSDDPMGYKPDSEGDHSKDKDQKKSIISMDVNCDDRFLACGTEQIVTDSFVMFWDVRSEKMLGGYWDSYGDSVTSVKFHAADKDRLATGGVDGLINIFDISQESEEDALITTLNTETSVQKVSWYNKGKDSISAISHDCEVIVWSNIDGIDPHKTFSREDVTIAMKRKTTEWCYVVDCHFKTDSKDLLVLSGSSYPKDPCLRLSRVKKTKLKAYSNLGQRPTPGSIVRASVLNSLSGGILIGKENGCLESWMPS